MVGMVLWYYLVVDTIILFLFELNPKIFSDLSSSQTTIRRNEYIHSAKVVPWQMFRGDVPSYIRRNEYPKKEFF